MKLLVIGAGGQLGQDLLARASRYGVGLEPVGHAQCDIASASEVRHLFENLSCDAVVNAAAYTKVDQAEDDEVCADSVNRIGAGLVAEQCRDKGVPLFHVSTDYVFDGKADKPYLHSDAVSPRSVYGTTKAAGERCVLEMHPGASVVRTSWLFGEHGPNFVKTMLRLAFERETLRVVADQIGCPTWSRDLADALLIMAKRTVAGDAKSSGVYHYCGTPQTSWYDLARQTIAEISRCREVKTKEIVPITTKEYPTPATRPMYSVLDCSRLEREFGIEPGEWRRGVEKVVQSELKHRFG